MEEKAACGMMKIKRGERTHGKNSDLHTNDLHSHLENWPGIRRFLDQRKRENERKKIRQRLQSI